MSGFWIRRMANPIPKKLQMEVWERDGGECQYCHAPGSLPPHHSVFGGTGRKRVHRIEILITLCYRCHRLAHTTKEMRAWCENWSRERYGVIVDELRRAKWSNPLR